MNISKVLPGPWTCGFFVTGRRFTWTVCIICLALSRAALWVGGEAASTPISPAVSSMIGIYLLVGFFKFYRVCRRTSWNFGKISRAPLHSGEFPFNWLCPMFFGEAPQLSANLMNISAQSGGFIPSNILVVLRYCFRVAEHPNARMLAFLRDSCCLVPCATGALKLQKGLIRDCGNCYRNSSTCLLF